MFAQRLTPARVRLASVSPKCLIDRGLVTGRPRAPRPSGLPSDAGGSVISRPWARNRARSFGAVGSWGRRSAPRAPGRPPRRLSGKAWSVRMEGYGGPAQPSPTIGQMHQRWPGLVRGRVQPLQDPGEPAAGRHPSPARHAAVEARGLAQVPVMPERPPRASGAHDQTHRDAESHALQVGASRRGSVTADRLRWA